MKILTVPWAVWYRLGTEYCWCQHYWIFNLRFPLCIGKARKWQKLCLCMTWNLSQKDWPYTGKCCASTGKHHVSTELCEQKVSMQLMTIRFLYNRLVLITCYLLDIDLAVHSLLLLWEVKFNQSWSTLFVIKTLSYAYEIIQPFITFDMNFVKSWIYYNSMKVKFYMFKRNENIDK